MDTIIPVADSLIMNSTLPSLFPIFQGEKIDGQFQSNALEMRIVFEIIKLLNSVLKDYELEMVCLYIGEKQICFFLVILG